jgi:hypothetical protein
VVIDKHSKYVSIVIREVTLRVAAASLGTWQMCGVGYRKWGVVAIHVTIAERNLIILPPIGFQFVDERVRSFKANEVKLWSGLSEARLRAPIGHSHPHSLHQTPPYPIGPKSPGAGIGQK